MHKAMYALKSIFTYLELKDKTYNPSRDMESLVYGILLLQNMYEPAISTEYFSLFHPISFFSFLIFSLYLINFFRISAFPLLVLFIIQCFGYTKKGNLLELFNYLLQGNVKIDQRCNKCKFSASENTVFWIIKLNVKVLFFSLIQ